MLLSTIVGGHARCQSVARTLCAGFVMRLAAMAIIGAASGCATPSERMAASADARGLRSGEVVGGPFRLRTYSSVTSGERLPHGTHLRVYIDGDGTPWIRGRAVAADPTPRRPLVLDLVDADPGAAILLGRPCYYGSADEPPCASHLWTDARYSQVVVDAMVQALTTIVTQLQPARVTLVGYSGGGVLAVLAAEGVLSVGRVLTVAANLDQRAWTDWHGYLPLDRSLNPVTRTRARRVEEIHLVGSADDVVPRALIAGYEQRFRDARVVERAGFDHRCCWAEEWVELITTYDP